MATSSRIVQVGVGVVITAGILASLACPRCQAQQPQWEIRDPVNVIKSFGDPTTAQAGLVLRANDLFGTNGPWEFRGRFSSTSGPGGDYHHLQDTAWDSIQEGEEKFLFTNACELEMGAEEDDEFSLAVQIRLASGGGIIATLTYDFPIILGTAPVDNYAQLYFPTSSQVLAGTTFLNFAMDYESDDERVYIDIEREVYDANGDWTGFYAPVGTLSSTNIVQITGYKSNWLPVVMSSAPGGGVAGRYSVYTKDAMGNHVEIYWDYWCYN